jgi:hypothetical protein
VKLSGESHYGVSSLRLDEYKGGLVGGKKITVYLTVSALRSNYMSQWRNLNINNPQSNKTYYTAKASIVENGVIATSSSTVGGVFNLPWSTIAEESEILPRARKRKYVFETPLIPRPHESWSVIMGRLQKILDAAMIDVCDDVPNQKISSANFGGNIYIP